MELRPRKARNSSVSASASKLPPPAASATPSAAPSPLSKITESGVPSRAKKKATPRGSHGPLDEEYKCTAQTERAPGFMNGDGALAKDQETGARIPDSVHDDVGTPPSSMAKSRAAQRTSQKATKDKSNLRATPAIAHIGTSPVVAVAEMENGVIQSAARTEDRRNSSSKKASRRRDATKQNLSDKVQTVSSDSECGRIQDNAVSPSMYTAVPVDERNLAPSFLKECTETETSLKQTPPIVSEVDVELSRIKYRNLNEEFSASLKQFSDASLQGTPSEDLENSQCNSLLVVALQTPGLSVGDRLQAVSSQKEWFSVGQTVEAKKEEGLTDGVNYCNGGEKTSVSGRKEAPCIGDKESLLLEVSAHSERGEPNLAFASRKKQEISVEAKVNLGQNGEAEDRRQNTREIYIDEDAEGSGGDDDDEAEEAAAKAFISCMKAHLQPHSRISMPAGKSQEKSFGGKPTAIIKEVQGMASNHHRLAALGLSWSPQTGLPPAKCRNASSSSNNSSSKGPETFWKKEQKLQDGLLMPPVDPSKLNKLARMHKEKSAGEKWYNLSAPTITPELKKDLQLLKLRRVVDPKRHYKADDSKGLPKHFQVGTVVGGAADFYSGRLTKKEQKSTLADELLADSAVSAYRKRKYLEIQKQQQSGGKAYFKKKKSKRTPSWARI